LLNTKNNKKKQNMALRLVKKVATGDSDLGGLKSSRYEKLQVSYGLIQASSYDLLDTLVFSDVPSQDIVRATLVAHADSPVTFKVYPGTTSADQPLTIGGLSAPVNISYVIEYIRGGGRVGSDAYASNEYGSGTALESGEGSLLTVIIGDIAGLTTTQVANLTTKQVSKLTKAQIKALTTAEAQSLTTTQIKALTTDQFPAMETSDFSVLTTTQLRAIEPEDIAVLTSSELRSLSTTQLHALTTTQTAALTTDQKVGLTTSQLAALQ
jgi:hypothetical protein